MKKTLSMTVLSTIAIMLDFIVMLNVVMLSVLVPYISPSRSSLSSPQKLFFSWGKRGNMYVSEGVSLAELI
jgi:hypothetical protein